MYSLTVSPNTAYSKLIHVVFYCSKKWWFITLGRCRVMNYPQVPFITKLEWHGLGNTSSLFQYAADSIDSKSSPGLKRWKHNLKLIKKKRWAKRCYCYLLFKSNFVLYFIQTSRQEVEKYNRANQTLLNLINNAINFMHCLNFLEELSGK